MKRNSIKALATVFLLASCFSGINPDIISKASAQPAHAAASVGSNAPDFSLADTTGKQRNLSDAKGKFVVLEWINFECPFVKKHYESNNMQKLQKTYTGKGVVWYSICSSAQGRSGNQPAEKINQALKSYNATPTAYLMDPSGKVGRSYGATSTPHIFIVNPKGTLIYAGAIDDNPSLSVGDTKKATNYLQKALDEAMSGKPVSKPSSAPYGCGVKY